MVFAPPPPPFLSSPPLPPHPSPTHLSPVSPPSCCYCRAISITRAPSVPSVLRPTLPLVRHDVGDRTPAVGPLLRCPFRMYVSLSHGHPQVAQLYMGIKKVPAEGEGDQEKTYMCVYIYITASACTRTTEKKKTYKPRRGENKAGIELTADVCRHARRCTTHPRTDESVRA